MELPAATLTALLDRWPVGRLATVSPAGQPHAVPVVFVRDGDCVIVPVDGKRKRGPELARVRNVREHGCASLLLDFYDGDWSLLWWVRLDGAADVLHPAGETLARLSAVLRLKYPQYAGVEPFSGSPTALRLRCERVSAWTSTGDPAAIEQATGGAAQLP